MISFYHSKFESLVRYGIIFWGADNERIPIFKLQKRVIRRMCGAGTGEACRELFEVLCCLKKYKSSVQKTNRYMVIIQG